MRKIRRNDEFEDDPDEQERERTHRHEHENEVEIKDIVIIAAAAVLFVTALLLPTDGWIRAVSFIIPYLLAGYEVIFEAIEKLIKGEVLDEDFLMSISSAAAFCIGDYPEAVIVMLLYKIGELFEAFAVGKSRKSVAELMDIRPDSANVETAEGILTVTPDYVNVDDVIVVYPGERIPLDGTIIEGISTVDSSSLTGESVPKAVNVGYEVYSGSINLTSPLRVKVTNNYAESTATRILDLVENSAENKSYHEAFITRFAKIYTPVVVAAAVLLAIVPSFITGEWSEWIRRAVVFLVVSCPCALVISVPLSYFGGIGNASKNGILIKGSNFMEALAHADTMVFDKTGTITEGRFTVTDVFPVGISEGQLLSYAAAAESFSNHPIAKALKEAGEVEAESGKLEQAEEIPGRGVSAVVDGKQIYVGNAALLFEHGIKYAVPSRSGAAIHVAVDDVYCGHILVADKIKKGAFESIDNLRTQGVKKFVMLTGDVMSVAKPIANKLNFDMLKAELMPDEKVSAVEYLIRNSSENSAVAFVGDGINDAPVLARADVGVAMGALGADAAIEAADIVLMDDDIRKLPLAVRISKFTARIAKENIIFSLLVKFAILALGVWGLVPIGAAVFGDVGVLIITIFNSLRTLKPWEKKEESYFEQRS